MIIDFHTHTFPARISARVLEHLSDVAHISYFSDGSNQGLLASMKRNQVDYSVLLPVMTRPDQVESLNSAMIRDRDSLLASGLIPFGGMHPDYPHVGRELSRLKENGIPGVKLHPAYQGVDIDDPRCLKIIEEASARDMIIMVHAGIDIGIFDHNYASVPAILSVLDRVGPKKLVLAHMGNWGEWDDVERDLAGAPVWLDTAFSLGPVISKFGQEKDLVYENNMSPDQFVRIVRKHGADRILFATDFPWADQAAYTHYITHFPLTDSEKEGILSGNAVKLLNLPDLIR